MVKFIIRYRCWFQSNIIRNLLSIFLILILIFVFGGCQSLDVNNLSLGTAEKPGTPQSTPTLVEPTSTSQPTREVPVATPTPTQKPEPKRYTHPENVFGLSIPVTWSASSGDELTRIVDPVSGSKINIEIIDTVFELDQDSLSRMVNAREVNVFGEYESYLETDRQSNNEELTFLVEKRLTEEGEPRTILSLYRQIGHYLLVLDLWSRLDYFEINETELTSILASLSVNESMFESEDIYGSILLTTFSNGSFSMEVPQYWNYRTTLADNSVVDTFTSPDQKAVIQMIVYDDGEPIDGSVAGAFVRNLLRNYYAKDIVVTSYKYLPDGQEELIWKSTGATYEGTTYFDARITSLIIYTVMYETDYKEIYSDLLTNALNSFQSIQSD